jgi:hypothetical protein
MRRIGLFLVSCAVLAAACASSTATTAPSSAPQATTSSAPASEGLPTSSAVPTASIVVTEAPSAALPAGWSTFTPEDGSFSMAFPGTPKKTTATQSAGTLGSIDVNGFAIEVTGVTYTAVQERFAAGTISAFSDTERDQFLTAIISGLAKTNDATTSNAGDLTFATYPAKKATVSANGQAEDVITFSFADDVYILFVKYDLGAAVDTTPFFSSFQLP